MAWNRDEARGDAWKGLLDWPRLRQQAASLLDELGFDKVDPDSRVADLSVAEQQLVQIAKAIAADARILVMDEPTARLPRPSVMNCSGLLID